ncbi:MAG: YabP/YqfC family sporulation protein [Clostridia bacterium]|nr:YabP/YqfC family sporulation protein [Clostridia bacterium]
MERKISELAPYRPQGHSVIIEGKRHVVISGVTEVDSFRDEEAVIMTQAGELSIFGNDLHLTRLNPDDGQVIIDGDIIAMEYAPPVEERRGLFSKAKR